MEAVAKQGVEFLIREGRRVQNLLKGKVIIKFKLNDVKSHANTERKFLLFNLSLQVYIKLFTQWIYRQG